MSQFELRGQKKDENTCVVLVDAPSKLLDEKRLELKRRERYNCNGQVDRQVLYPCHIRK